MKEIRGIGHYLVNGKQIVMVSDEFHGKTLICYQYDVLIGSRNIINKFRKELIPEHQLKKGWCPIIKYI
jgi:hypothetical protein